VKDRDHKLLELLYESIANNDVLLHDEEQFINQLAKDITDNIYKNISPNMRFWGSERLSNIVHSQFLNNLYYGDAFKNTNNNQTRAIGFVFEKAILNVMYDYLVTVEGRNMKTSQPEKVCFKTIEDWMNGIRDKAEEIPYKNKEEVFEMMKKTIINSLLYMYNSYSDPHGMYKNEAIAQWYEWRKDRLKFQNLSDKLPELEGVF
jgi:hypothetical protein